MYIDIAVESLIVFFEQVFTHRNMIALLQTQPFISVLKIHVLKNFAKFTGKHVYRSVFFNKVAGQRATILLKKKLGTGVFL